MGKTYFIADTHFNHENIIKYCDRPFEDVKQMGRKLISNWNSVVKDDDVVYILGDFALADKPEIIWINRSLNGIKKLIIGNHDHLSIKDYYDCGFDRVYDKPILFNDFYILSHEPQYVQNNGVYANIFGHVHNNPQFRDYSDRHFCCCVERIGYKPISFEEIVEKMKSYEK